MPNNSTTYIVNDQATETDALDFTPYVETLDPLLPPPNTTMKIWIAHLTVKSSYLGEVPKAEGVGNTPLTIGVFGTWGSGKTSLMKYEL